ncbi:MAG: glycosyltransferase family 2 protein [Candidatus Omnitrophica bacterium]|nr:glycosyltransferase family 2 protein [Candidatus Omnitrophota bacterium]
MQLSVIMPVYNEVRTIKEVVERVQEQPFNKEIIIVDDGSTDGTREILNTLKDPNVKVVLKEKNSGKGASLKEAARHVTGEFCIIQDADLEYDPNDFKIMLDLLIHNKADVVYGSRFLSRTRIFYFNHLLGNKIVNVCANVLFNTTFTDLETGYKAFRSDILKEFPFRSTSFGFEVEFTSYVIKKKLRVYEVPISYYGRTYEEGKKLTWKDGLKALFWIFYCKFFR